MLAIPLHELLSGVSGSISIAAWIFVLVPQIVENFRLKSSQGISLAFLSIWFLGDVTNLVGSLLAHLLKTVISLAVWFCVADVVLILQCLYYRVRNARELATGHEGEADPLLGQTQPHSGNGSISSTPPKRNGSDNNNQEPADPLPNTRWQRTWLVNVATALLVCTIGVLGWLLAYHAGLWLPVRHDGHGTSADQSIAAVSLGYASAVCYLGARVPQIIKNFQNKSCGGLSLLFFMLSLIGNLTYGASILFHSLEPEYILINTPWLIGSIGTIVEDVAIFGQFYVYGTDR